MVVSKILSQNVGENVVDDEYFFEKNSFGIQYREGKVYSISMATPRRNSVQILDPYDKLIPTINRGCV